MSSSTSERALFASFPLTWHFQVWMLSVFVNLSSRRRRQGCDCALLLSFVDPPRFLVFFCLRRSDWKRDFYCKFNLLCYNSCVLFIYAYKTYPLFDSFGLDALLIPSQQQQIDCNDRWCKTVGEFHSSVFFCLKKKNLWRMKIMLTFLYKLLDEAG